MEHDPRTIRTISKYTVVVNPVTKNLIKPNYRLIHDGKYCQKIPLNFLNKDVLLELCCAIFFNRAIERTYRAMRGLMFFQKPCYREIRAMRGRVMRGLPVVGRVPGVPYNQTFSNIMRSLIIFTCDKT